MADEETITENLQERLHRLSVSHADNGDDDGKDPFADFEELTDSPNAPSATSPATSPDSVAPINPTNRNSAKFETPDAEDWDEGVDAKDDVLFAAPPAAEQAQPQGQAYVKSKIQELTTVQEQAESTKDNPSILQALTAVLEALKKQIESAYENEKIDAQDHSTLIERLHSVRELIASK